MAKPVKNRKYRKRGNSHCVLYWYRTPDGKRKQKWETYHDKSEALQREAFIDNLEEEKRHDEIYAAVRQYDNDRKQDKHNPPGDEASEESHLTAIEKLSTTMDELFEIWLPSHAISERFSPNTYESYQSNWNIHIRPYFGSRIASTITSEDMSNFIMHLNKKPVTVRNGLQLDPHNVRTLSSSTVKKCFDIVMGCLKAGKVWKYIHEVPEQKAPDVEYAERNSWRPFQARNALEKLQGNSLMHLAVHMSFILSLRAGETVGISIDEIKLDTPFPFLRVFQQVQRLNDSAISKTPREQIRFIFPKHVPTAKSSLVLKNLKCSKKKDNRERKLCLPRPLAEEIKNRLEEIQRNKEFYGSEYHDYGLLICLPNGRPIDPKDLGSQFKDWQVKAGLDDLIEFQGLRKSGQEYKSRFKDNEIAKAITAKSAGQSVRVMMEHYNTELDEDLIGLTMLVEKDFYPQETSSMQSEEKPFDAEATLQALQGNPELAQQVLQLLLSNAVKVS